MTPSEVWEGWSPTLTPLETAIISSETIDNFSKNEIFFTVEKFEEDRLRAFARIHYDKRWCDNRPAVLLLPSLENKHDYTFFAEKLVKEGYLVCVLDYSGNLKTNDFHTTFPKELSYASIKECKQHMLTISSSARNTPWFWWAKIARRAVSMLEEHRLVQKNRIGIFGFGTGAQIAWQVAGVDKRLSALIPVNGGGYLWSRKPDSAGTIIIPENDNERAFSSGVGAETYAKQVTCPTCLIASSNSAYFNVEKVKNIFSIVPSQSKQLIISKGTDSQISKRSFDSMLLWLRANFAFDKVESPSPELFFENINDRLYVRLNTDKPASENELYIAKGDIHPIARYWDSVVCSQKIGENQFTCQVEIASLDETLLAFATISYPDGTLVSTPAIKTTPRKLGINKISKETRSKSRLLYNSSMALDAFSVSTNDILKEDDLLSVEKGACGIAGVTTKKGSLSLLRKPSDMSETLDATIFMFDAFSTIKRRITVKMLTKTDTVYYSAEVDLLGENRWQKILLKISDFKSENGKTLTGFDNIASITFVDGENILFNNMLWI